MKIDRRALTMAAFSVVLLAAACDGDGIGTTQTPKTTKGRPQAGSVNTSSPQAFRAGTEAFDGDAIFANDELETAGTTSSIDFEVDSVSLSCIQRRDSRSEVQPSSTVALRVIATPMNVSVWCTTPSKSLCEVAAGEEVQVTCPDPVFGIVVDDNGVTVKVTFGIVEVRSHTTGESTVVGAGQQVSISPEEPPGSIVAVETLEEDLDIAQILQERFSRDPFEIGPGESQTLAGLFNTRQLLIAVDGSRLGEDPAAQELLEPLMDVLRQKLAWEIGVEQTTLEEGVELVRSGEFDLVLSPDKSAELTGAPLFATPERVVWLLQTPVDLAFADAFSPFHTAVISDGEFGAVYEEITGTMIDYGLLFGSP